MFIPKQYTVSTGYTEIMAPGKMGVVTLHFGILSLSPETTYFDHSEETEVALIALGGQCTLLVGHNGNKAYGVLGERSDVFAGEACVAYVPHHTTYELLVGESGVTLAVCKVASHAESAAVILAAGEPMDPDATGIRVWENLLPEGTDCVRTGIRLPAPETESICLHKFRDPAGTAVLQVAAPSDTGDTQVRVRHNAVFALPIQQRIVSLTSDMPGYQLWVQPAI